MANQHRPGWWIPLSMTLMLALTTLPSRGVAASDGPDPDVDVDVSLVTDALPGEVANRGLGKLTDALRARGLVIDRAATPETARGKTVVVAGLFTGDGQAAALLKSARIDLPAGPEALVVHHLQRGGKPAWLLAGSDARGLMYAARDTADRVGWGTGRDEPFRDVHDTVEHPAVHERAISLYTMNRAYWESRFHDAAYWDRYLDTLARNRFNTLVLIFGYENGGFLAPPYPYFFDVPGFPDVRMVGLTADQQARNLAALERLTKMAHARGLNVTLGIWDHIYRGGVQTGGVPGADAAKNRPTPGLVSGVTTGNLTAYTNAALAELFRRVPGIDALQFRMHDESGLKSSEQEAFWRSVFTTMKEHAPGVRFDARAKGLPDAVIDAGVAMGVNLRITTKYWMEQMGLPFHPTHINPPNQLDRRHSYADLLRYPQRYTMHWRLWNGGTARVLLWADPDYARRFAASTHLHDGDGFEVNEPLATKMEAQPHDAQPFDLLNTKYRYYDYEFERYWHFFQVFGRLGYNPETPEEVWRREFDRRFGPEAGPHVEAALHRASQVLPRIVAACYPYSAFPTTRGWAERQRLGDLPAYAKAEGSDPAQFASFDEEAQLRVEGGETAKIRPPATSRWFERTAAAVLDEVAAAERMIGTRRNTEFDSTVADLKILASLARFHARRIPAAVEYRLFERMGDASRLDRAIAGERQAIQAWRDLVAAAGDVYTDDLAMGLRSADLAGHWRDELPKLERGLAELERRWVTFEPRRPPAAALPAPATASDDVEPPTVTHRPVTSAPAGKPLTIAALVTDPSGVKWVRLRYRSVNQHDDYRTLPMLPLPTGPPGRYEATVPCDQVVPQWDFMYYIEVMDHHGNGRIHPDLERETPYVVVRLVR
jgi:hypothetical protein